LLGLFKLLVNLTLAAEGQQLLHRHLPPALLPSVLEDVVLFIKEGEKEGGKERGREGGREEEVQELTAQLCYLLRNLSFLRGGGGGRAGAKAGVLASGVLLRFLVLDAMTHANLQIRFPATVALWSLLHHSEKSTALLLRGDFLVSSTPSSLPSSSSVPSCVGVWQQIALAKKMVGRDRKEGQGEGGREGGGEEGLMVEGVRRALENIEALLSSLSTTSSSSSSSSLSLRVGVGKGKVLGGRSGGNGGGGAAAAAAAAAAAVIDESN
jgi:hypothetical protein